jgi:hypothetical protein
MVAQVSCSKTRTCWLRAWDRAKSEKLIPFRNADGTWSCKSYTIAITGPGWSDITCTCAAGRNGRICKHSAVVAFARANGLSPIRPALVALEGAEKAAFRPTASTVIAGDDPLAVAFG